LASRWLGASLLPYNIQRRVMRGYGTRQWGLRAIAAVALLFACRSWSYGDRLKWARDDGIEDRIQACDSDDDCVSGAGNEPTYCMARAHRLPEKPSPADQGITDLLLRCVVVRSDEDCLCMSGLCVNAAPDRCEEQE
jgi:hypothetical protein